MYRKVAVLVGLLLVVGSAGAWSQDIQDIVFYDTFESSDTSGWWAPARVGETGQKTCYDPSGDTTDAIPCAGTGQDGDIRPGVEWPNPRFVDNADGTVTDMLTGLVWLRDAKCVDLLGVGELGLSEWTTALTAAADLESGTCSLSDGSVAGAWRMPNVNELMSLMSYNFYDPMLSNGSGRQQWSEGDVFSGVPGSSAIYWSSTSSALNPAYSWSVCFSTGQIRIFRKNNFFYVWPVRNGL